MPLVIPKIEFDTDGPPLSVEIVFPTLQVVSYTLTLKEAGSNSVVVREEGDNTNPEDDKYVLPTPSSMNNMRSLLFGATFIDPGQKPTAPFRADAIVRQGTTECGRLVVAGVMSDRSSSGSDWAKLVAKGRA
jgi:hypothetical protein